MLVTCWGARGSIATPGPQSQRFGGNTSCFSVEIEDAIVILDAGTGIRKLGLSAAESEKELIVVLSHIHTDHICGFPFFRPIYQDRVIHLVDHVFDGARWSLLDMLDGLHFPVVPSMLPSTLRRESASPEDFLARYGLDVKRIEVNHPGGAYGLRLSRDDKSVVYIPDNEVFPPATSLPFERLAAFCEGADILIHDAQYSADEMGVKKGWGHSSVDDVAQLALASGVRHVLLFHHDPDRSDDAVAEMERRARALLEGTGIACDAAFEGMKILLADTVAMEKKE